MRLNQISLLAAVAFCSLLGLSSAEDDAKGKGGDKPKVTSTISGLSIESTKPTANSTPAAGAGTGSTNSKVIAVVVGSPTLNKSLVFTPNEITAKPGDVVQFQFSQVNHTVTQSTFAEPCMPVQQSDPNAAGIHSGFVPGGSANETTVQTFDMPINDTTPMFIYCAQGPHCQLGMVMTINANNGTENLAAYKAAAANATANVPANNFKGGVRGSIPKADAVPPPV